MTTESILADLHKQRAEHLEAGRLAEVRRVDQQVIAHQTLARLRREHAEHLAAGRAETAAGLAAQISYWRSMVDVDADDVAGEHGPELVALPAGSEVKPTKRRGSGGSEPGR